MIDVYLFRMGMKRDGSEDRPWTFVPRQAMWMCTSTVFPGGTKRINGIHQADDMFFAASDYGGLSRKGW